MCGKTRDVRKSLVEGYTVLACASHRGVTHEDLAVIVPEGGALETEFDVAGFFHGYTIVTPDRMSPGQKRSLYRAHTIAAAAAGRPAPEPPDDSDDAGWLPAKLVEAITDRVGPDGWEIADFDGDRRCYVVKVYTDWGWAGFIDGTAGRIASQLAEIKASAARDLERLKCPTCHSALHPHQSRQCGCGTVAWMPAQWLLNDPTSILPDLLTYIDHTDVTIERAHSHLHAALMLAGGDYSAPTFFGTGPEVLSSALELLVPGATWETYQDKLVGILPTGVRWEPQQAAVLAQAAAELGYSFATGNAHGFGYHSRDLNYMEYARRDLGCIDAQADDDPTWPAWFTAADADTGPGATSPGLAIGHAYLPYIAAPDGYDEDQWQEAISEAEEDCELTGADLGDGWQSTLASSEVSSVWRLCAYREQADLSSVESFAAQLRQGAALLTALEDRFHASVERAYQRMGQ